MVFAFPLVSAAAMDANTSTGDARELYILLLADYADSSSVSYD